jgi:hypothetical protein
MRTEFLASSHMSTDESFHTCATMEYSSIKGSFNRENDRDEGQSREWDVHLGEMELHRIIGGQRDAEAALIIFQHRIAVEVEEERIVAQR